jgi:hypothetical protein
MSRRVILAVLLSAFGAGAAHGQILRLDAVPSEREGTWIFSFGGQMAQPIGALRTNVDRAWGVGGSVRHHFRWFTPLGIRGDLGWLNYGSENQRVPLSPTLNRVLVDMRTTNNIAVFSGGPELMLTKGPIRPYVYAFAGFSYFYTESSAGDDNGSDAFATTTNFDDGGLATGWGSGLHIPLQVRSVGAAIDAGVRLTRNGTRSYLRPGDIRDQPDGSLVFSPRTTQADFWQYHLGISFSPRRR